MLNFWLMLLSAKQSLVLEKNDEKGDLVEASGLKCQKVIFTLLYKIILTNLNIYLMI